MSASVPASSSIGVGIVGLSAADGWAAAAHVPALTAVDGYRLRALTASSPETSRAAAEKYGVKAFDGVEALAESPEVDLVVVAVKVPRHRELVLAALRAGKAVFCEWPLGRDLAEAQEMAALAGAQQLRTAVGLQARSAPAVRYLRDLIAQGYVGEVLSTSLIGSGRAWGESTNPRGHYLLDRDNGATLLSIPFGHTVDALSFVLGEFTEVGATLATRRGQVADTDTGELVGMSAEDQVVVNGMLRGGAVASVHYRGGLSRATNFHWEINGTAGDLVVSGGSGHLQMSAVTIRGAQGQNPLRELPVPASYAQVEGIDPAAPACAVAHAYAQLRDDLHGGTQFVPDFAHAVGRHQLIEQIQRAATTGQRLAIG